MSKKTKKDKNDKASVYELDKLHNLVASQLAGGLDDPKILSLAIKFLKDNNITTDIIETDSMQDLTSSIKELIEEEKESKGDNVVSIQDLLEA